MPRDKLKAVSQSAWSGDFLNLISSFHDKASADHQLEAGALFFPSSHGFFFTLAFISGQSAKWHRLPRIVFRPSVDKTRLSCCSRVSSVCPNFLYFFRIYFQECLPGFGRESHVMVLCAACKIFLFPRSCWFQLRQAQCDAEMMGLERKRGLGFAQVSGLKCSQSQWCARKQTA